MVEVRAFEEMFSTALRNGVSYASKERGSGVAMVNMKEIFAYDRIEDQRCELAPLTQQERHSFLLEAGDLLFARQSLTYEGAGKCVLVMSSVHDRTWESHIMRVRLDPAVASPAYFYYYFRSPQGRRSIEAIVQQVAAAGIRGSDLRKLAVPAVALSEQQRIAEVLGALDDKIAANGKLARTAGDLAKAHCSQAGELVNLGAVARQAKTTIEPSAMPGDRVWQFSLPAFDDGEVPEDTKPQGILSAKFRLDHSCVLVSKLNPRIPRIWDIPVLPPGLAVASTEFVVLESDVCSTSVLWALTSQRHFSSLLEERVTGTSGSHQRVKPADLLATPIGDPRRMPRARLDLVTSLGVTRKRAIDESAALATTRDALLPHLMSGRLRVRDAEKIVGDHV